MKISQLPPEIKEKAIGYKIVETDDLEIAFTWAGTKEGFYYWEQWNNKCYLTHQLQQLNQKYPNDLEFGAQVRKLISEL